MSSVKKKILVISAVIALGSGVALYFSFEPLLQRVLRDGVPKIEKAASEFLGTELQIQAILPRLNFLRPEFDFIEIKAFDPVTKTNPFTVSRATLGLDILGSLLARTPKFGKLEIAGAKLELIEKTPKKWQIAGFNAAGSSEAGPPSWLGRKFQLHFSDLKLKISPLGKPFSDVSLDDARAKLRGGAVIQAEISLSGILLNLPEIWEKSSRWKSFSADLDWDPNQKKAAVHRYSLANSDLRIEGSGGLEFNSGLLSVVSRLKSFDLIKLKQALPLKIFPQGFSSWFTTALESGHGDEAQLQIQGNPSEWKGLAAFDGKKNSLELTAKVSGLGLVYLDEWPKLSRASGQLRLENQSFQFTFDSASAGAMSFSAIQGAIPNLAGHREVKLQAKVSAPEEPLLSFLKNGPFRKVTPQLLEIVVPTGTTEAELSVNAPLSGEKAQGQIFFQQASLHHPKWELDLKEIHGKLEFAPKGLTLTDFEGKLLGHPLSLSGTVTTEAATETQLTLKGQLPADRIHKIVPAFPYPEIMRGDLDSELEVKIHSSPGGASHQSVDWKSELVGAEILAPFPLGKTKTEAIQATAHIESSDRGLELLRAGWVRAHEPKADLQLELRSSDGKKQASAKGSASRLIVDDWTKWWGEREKSESSEDSGFDFDANMKVDSVEWKDYRFHDGSYQLAKTDHQYRAKLNCEEALGEVSWRMPLPESTVSADFKFLVLPKYPEISSSDEQGSPSPQQKWDLKSWPSFKIKIADLSGMKNGKREKVGALELDTKQTGKAIYLEHFLLSHPEYEVSAEMGETHYGKDPKTAVSGMIKLKQYQHQFDPGKSITAAELSDGAIRIRAKWPGGPEEFAKEKLESEISGKVQSGTFGVNSGWASFFSFLGGGSVTDRRKQIQRFNKMAFEMNSKDGFLYTKYVKAFLGDHYLNIEGRTSLVEKKLDLEAEVTLWANKDETPEDEDEFRDPNAPENQPKGGVSKSFHIVGPWNDPNVKIF